MINMENKKDFEDIISDSHLKRDEYVDLASMSSNYKSRRFKKKKRGIAGFFSNIGEGISKWWRNSGKMQKAAVILLSSVIAILLAGIIFVTSYFDYNYNSITNKPENLGFEDVIDEKIVNIALFGIDSRSHNFSGNSDSIMVLSLNTEKKSVKIVSIMRDSLVKINKKGKTTYNKINSAYASGGPELAIKTINENFGLDISEYATVNFEGMMDIIDAVGGIEAELTSKEVVAISKNGYAFNAIVQDMCSRLGLNPEKYYITTPGVHHLNGVQAVAYSRIRKAINIWGTNNDHGRTDRQRYVMEQLFNKALKLNKSNYIKLAKALIPCSETSLSYTEILNLATDILLKSPTFEQSRVPLDKYQMSTPTIKGIGSCVYYDLEYASKVLHAFFYDDVTPEEYMELNGVQKNDWYSGKTSSSSSKPSSSTSKPSSSSNSTPSNTTSSNTSSTSSSVTSSENTSSNTSNTSSDSNSSGGNQSDNSSTTSGNNSSKEETSSDKDVSSDKETSSDKENSSQTDTSVPDNTTSDTESKNEE